MKKTLFVMALAVVLVFALAATALATSAKTWNYQSDYYSWGSVSGNGIPSATATNTLGMGGTGIIAQQNANPTNPGVHANYQTTTAKCGICHSVHRASATGVKLLNSSSAGCDACHVANSAVTLAQVAWTKVDTAKFAGPHGSNSQFNTEAAPGTSSCGKRACHSTSPHGAGGSTYPLFRSKLLTAAADADAAIALGASASSGVTLDILNGVDFTANGAANMDSVRVGYTCNSEGCHEQTMLSVIKAGYGQNRELTYPLGNIAGNQAVKTGHMTGVGVSDNSTVFAPVSSCTSCHDQTTTITRSGYTFPHAQSVSASTVQNYLWYNLAANTTAADVPVTNSNMKSFDGACLKCHRTTTSGVGLTF